MANIWVTGASGQLGMALRQKGFSFWDEVFYTDKEELDITDRDAVRQFVVGHEIDTIINCAAYIKIHKSTLLLFGGSVKINTSKLPQHQ